MDSSGHDCGLRAEAYGTVNGSIVGDGAEITCKRKLKDSQGLLRTGLDDIGSRPARQRQTVPDSRTLSGVAGLKRLESAPEGAEGDSCAALGGLRCGFIPARLVIKHQKIGEDERINHGVTEHVAGCARKTIAIRPAKAFSRRPDQEGKDQADVEK